MTHTQFAIALWRHFGACDRECAVCRAKFIQYGARVATALSNEHDARAATAQVHARVTARMQIRRAL